jgi:hypothetical protein
VPVRHPEQIGGQRLTPPGGHVSLAPDCRSGATTERNGLDSAALNQVPLVAHPAVSTVCGLPCVKRKPRRFILPP